MSLQFHPPAPKPPVPKPGRDPLGQNCLKRIRRSPGGNEMTVNISKHLLGIACIIAGALIPLILCMLTLLPTGFDPRGAAKLIQPTFPIWLKAFSVIRRWSFNHCLIMGPFCVFPAIITP